MVPGLNRVVEDEEDESVESLDRLAPDLGTKKRKRAESKAFIIADDYDSEFNE